MISMAFLCARASFPHFVWLAKWKNKRLGNYFQLHLPMDNALVWQTSYLITYSFSSLMRWVWIYFLDLLAHVEHTHLYFDHLWFAWDLKGAKGKTKLFNMATNLDTVCDLSTIWQIWPSSNAIFAILPSLILISSPRLYLSRCDLYLWRLLSAFNYVHLSLNIASFRSAQITQNHTHCHCSGTGNLAVGEPEELLGAL